MGNTRSLQPKDEDIIILHKGDLWTRLKERICSTIEDVGVGGVSYNDIEEIGWGFRVALLYMLFYAVMLIFSITSNTVTLSHNKYLSLDDSDSTQKCTEIPQTLTATFEGSYEGYWNTNPKFNFNSSLYVLELSGASLNNEEYYQIMSSFQDNLQVIGTKASNRSALWSLIVWSTFTYTAKDSSVVFYSNADAGVIFNLKSYVATLSSREGNCADQLLSGSFDVASKQLSITFLLNNTALAAFLEYPTSGAVNNLEPCPAQGNFVGSRFLNPFWMNDRSGFFELSFDVRSAVIAMALNLNLINASALVKTTTQASENFHSYLYIDADYSPPMSPVICLDKVDTYWNLTQQQINGPEICFVYQGADNELFFAYPMMINLNGAFNGACNCPQDAEVYNCNIADYVIGFIYDLNFDFNVLVETLAIKMQDIIVKDPDNGDVTVINTLAPILTNTILLQYGANDDYYDDDTNAINLKNVYDSICSSCGTAVIELWGYDGFYYNANNIYYNQLIFAMNQNGVQLSELSNKEFTYVANDGNKISQPQFMCINSFSQPLALTGLARNPPVPLIQNYFECRLSTSSAFQQAVGIASGSASLYTSIFIAIFGFFFIKYMKHVKKIKLHTKRTMDKKKELHEENLSRIHKKEMVILKTMIVELSEALMMQSNGSTKDKLNKSLLELKYLSYSDDDRVSRLDSDINPLYTDQNKTVRNVRMDDNVITISDDRVSRLGSDINPDQEMTVRNVRMDDSIINPLSIDKDVPC